MGRTEEPKLWDVADEAEPPEDWLATVIRLALHAWTEDAEPLPTTWDLIKQRAATSRSSHFAPGRNSYEEAQRCVICSTRTSLIWQVSVKRNSYSKHSVEGLSGERRRDTQ